MLRFTVFAATVVLLIVGPESAPTDFPDTYHQPIALEQALPSQSEAFLQKAIADAFKAEGDEAPVIDANLVAACRLLCRVLDCTPEASGGDDFESQTIQFAMRRMGTTDSLYFPIVATVKNRVDAAALLRDVVHRSLAAMRVNRFGVAFDPGNGMLVAVFTRRLAQVGPFPMEVDPGSTQLLWGSMVDGASNASLLLSTPDEALFETGMNEKAGLFWTRIYFPEEPGVYTVELMARDDGPQVASLFPVYVGVPVPTRPVVKVVPGLEDKKAPTDIEAQVVRLINYERTKRGVAPCVEDPVLRKGARGHSSAMARAGRLTHSLSKKTADFVENIAVSASIGTAHWSLMACPSHRRYIVDDELKRCGVGVSVVELDESVRLIYLTQRFGRAK